MSEAIWSARDAVRGSRTLQIVFACVVGLVVAAGASIATRMGMLPMATAAAAAGLLALTSLRWPLLPLFVLVAIIPLEDAVTIAGIGTLSKVVGILFAIAYAVPRIGHIKLRAMPPAGWAYFGWAALSVLWAIDPNVAQGKIQTLVQLFIVGVLVADAVAHDPTIVRPLLWVYTLAAAVTAVIGIAGYASGFNVDGGRVSAIAGQDPAQFAAVLLPALVFSLHELVHGRRTLLSGIVALACTIAIVQSGTRGAWVSAVVVVCVLLIPRLRPQRRVVAIAAVLVLLVVAFQIPGLADLVNERTSIAASTGGAGRTDIWASGLRIYQTAPLTGVGYANFPVAYTSAILGSSPVETQGFGRGSHSIIVGTLGELGLVGFVCLALFLAPLIFRRGWGPDAALVQAILASVMISALFLDVLSNRKQVWIAIGLAAGLAYLARQAAKGDRDISPDAPASPAQRTAGAASPRRRVGRIR